MKSPVFFTQPHLGPASRHGCQFETQEAGFMLSQNTQYSPLPHNMDNLPDQYDMQDLEVMGKPLHEVALFQTSAISSSLAEPPSKTTHDETHTLPTPEANVEMNFVGDKLSPVLRAHRRGAMGGPKSKLHQKRSALDESPQCYICRTTDTPKWRTGPFGPNSFCNFCGLLYDKRRSRRDLSHQRG